MLRVVITVCLFAWLAPVVSGQVTFYTPPAGGATITIAENEATGSGIYTLQATDPAGNSPVFSIVTQSPATPAFLIDAASDNLAVPNLGLDAETTTQFTFKFRVTAGTSTAVSGPLIVTVDDVNDLDPEFENTPYTGEIWKNDPEGTTIVTVTATDPDISNLNISYSIAGAQTTFFVNSSSRAITLADPSGLAALSSPTELQVQASDGGRTGTATATVTINDDPCAAGPCKNGGTCSSTRDIFTCTCLSGYSGSQCESVDYCYQAPCKNGGTCINSAASYVCTCPGTYTGQNCTGAVPPFDTSRDTVDVHLIVGCICFAVCVIIIVLVTCILCNSCWFTYIISIRSGDRFHAWKDADVVLTLFGQGFSSEETKLGRLIKHDLEEGNTDILTIYETPVPKVDTLELRCMPTLQVPKVDTLELRCMRREFDSDWFLESITVTNQRYGDMVEFPVLRWINDDTRYTLIPYDTCLPQNDTRSEQRRKELLVKQRTYTYRSWYPDLPTKTSLPSKRFPNIYTPNLFGEGVKRKMATLLMSYSSEEFKTIGDIKSMYTSCGFPIPPDTKKWNNDRKFAMQRLTGVNTRQIALCIDIPATMAVTSKMVEPFLEGKSLSAAVDLKRVFIVNHKILHDVRPATGLTVCAPIALFYQQNDGTLMPIAIQLFQEEGEDNPVFLPTDDNYTWILAKMWFNNADAQVNEALAYLGYSHLFMEGVDIASNRQLSVSHPIYKLLKPHFLYLLSINSLAVTDLLKKPDGFFNSSMSIGTDECLRLINKKRSVWRLDVDGTLPKELQNRGVDDQTLLPDYYYREDAMDIYDATKRYVTDYVNIYYNDDNDMIEDHELQAWRAELTKEAPLGAGLMGVPGTNGKFKKKEDLILTLTSVIFTCSAEHAAVNLPQYDEYAFPLNYPSRLRGTPPQSKEPRKIKDVMKTLPEPKTVMEGNIIFKILSTRGPEALGKSEINYIYDPRAKQVVDTFRERLAEISENIEERGTTLRVNYNYLNPENIPNGIRI